MNTDSLHFALNSVSNIINNNLNKKYYKQQIFDIQKFVNKFGFECERHLYRCIFLSLLNTQISETNKTLLYQLFTDLGNFFEKPNFYTLVQFCLNKEKPIENLINQEASKNLKSDPSLLSKIKELARCLKFSDCHKLALFFCFDELTNCQRELRLSKCDFTSLTDLTHFMSIQLELSDEPIAKEVIAKIREDLESSSLQASSNQIIPFFTPFSNVKMESNSFSGISGLNDDQIANMLVNESSAQLTSEVLSQFNVTPRLCAKILFSLCDDLRSSENNLQQRTEEIDTLANLCREFLPSASPLMDILQSIDNEAFIAINNKVIGNKNFGKISSSFSRFWQFCINLCNTDKQGISILGMVFLGRVWNYNLEFQLGTIINCAKSQLIAKLLSVGPTGPGPGAGSDLSQIVANLESLKCQPDFETNAELSNWKYQKLYQIIMDISAANAPNKQSLVTMGSMFYIQIVDLFKWPIQNCPDLVALGLLGCSNNLSPCKNEILSLTIPAFLSNHSNAAIILHTIWNTNELIGPVQGNNQWAKQVLLQAMCEYYMKSPIEEQQQRLSRILDVAQDLKALSLLLNSNCYPFVIDLACLASRREYLKLDKWLMDKIESNGEPFVNACIVFLNRRCAPFLSGGKSLEINSLNSSLPSETLATILACLQQFICNNANNVTPASLSSNLSISPELSETILTMVANSSFLLQKVPRQAPPGVINTSTNVKSSIIPATTTKSINDLGLVNISLAGTSSSFNSQSRQPFATIQAVAQSNTAPVVSSANVIISQTSQAPVGQAKSAKLSQTANTSQPISQQSQQQSAQQQQPQPQAPASGQSQSQQKGQQTQPSQQSQQQQQQGQQAGQQAADRRVVVDLSNIFPDIHLNVNPEIEKEADTYFQRIYNQSAAGSMSIDDVLEMLKKFQDSQVKRERDVFQCMIKNLFKEYIYFPQYPDKELLTTAQLFGGIIQMGLVKYMPLVVALRYILEALRKPFGSKMYYFGIAALERFKTKLKDYPLYCQHLTSIPHFHQFPRHLIEYIEYGIASEEPNSSLAAASNNQSSLSPAANQINQSLPGIIGSNITTNPNSESSSRPGMIVPGMINTQGSLGTMATQGLISNLGSQVMAQNSSKIFSNAQTSQASISKSIASSITSNSVISSGSTKRTGPSIANATNIDTLLAAGETMYTNPPEAIQDKIAFIINNLSQINLAQKCEEFKEAIGNGDTYHGWVSQYFVMKRASIEPNFHTLYANFLDMLKLPELSKLVIKETYRNIKVLLRSDKEFANFSDRSLLKNLGHWLGMLTLAKNKPILALDLNLKFLLIEAYHKGTQELLYVVPFIAKVLESCAKSQIFKAPNPWTIGIIKSLVELHQEPNLKLNLRFEVEVLCKALNIDLNDHIGKSNNLKDENVMNKVMQEQQLAFGLKSSSNQITAQLASQTSSQPPSLASQFHSQPGQIPGQISCPTPSQPNQGQPSISLSNQILKQTTLQQSQHLQPQALTMPMMQQSLVVSQGQPNHSLLAPNASPTVQLGLQHVTGTSTISMAPTSSSPSAHLFNYHDISANTFSQHVVISNNLPLLQMNPSLKQWIRPSIERAVQEWMGPVVDRSTKISLLTAEQIIKKDFALESDENRMCLAAQYLIRNLTAGMAMITSKEGLFVTMTATLIQAFTRQLGPASSTTKEIIEATANTIASDNIDLACCLIEKTAIEKAIPELDKRLSHDYEIRRKARLEGRRYCDASSLTYQAERMPEAIRLKVGSVTQHQFQVYEDIGKNIPGFIAPISDHPSLGLVSTITNTAPNNLGPPLGSIGPVSNTVGLGQQFMKNMNNNLSSIISPAVPLSSNNMSANINIQPPTSVVPRPISAFNNDIPSNNIDSGLQNLYDKLVTELESLLNQFLQAMQPNHLITTMHSILEIVVASRSNPRDIGSAMTLIQRVLEALGELIISIESGLIELMLLTRARDLYLVILKALADPRAYGHQWTTKQITTQMLERLLNPSTPTPTPPIPNELFDILMRSDLINISLMDHQLAQLIENTQSPIALAFTLQFVKIYGQVAVHENQIPNIIAALLKISKSAGSSNPLSLEIQQTLEIFRSNPATISLSPATNDAASNFMMNSGIEVESDSPEFMEKTERLMRDWINLYHSNTYLNKVFHIYVQSMNQHGILKTDDSITKFFRLSTELCVEYCYRILNNSQSNNNQSIIETRTKCFHTLDAFAHLIVMLVKHSGSNTGAVSESTPKLNLLNKVLGIIAGVAVQDQENRNDAFQHLPYYRIFIILFMELTLGPNNLGLPGLNTLQHQLGFGVGPNQLDPFYETIQFQVLSAFCQTLKILKPSKAPSFAFARLDFISHRTFMEKCLNSPNSSNSKGWALYAQLLIEIIQFEAPFLRNVELPQSIDLLYKGTLKVLLVTLHDFPEFLCEYCYDLCDAIPCNAIQMRNLVLSAFPRNMRLPDPFTPNLKIDSLPEISQPPKGTASPIAALANVPFRQDLDSYIRTRSPVTFLSELRGYLQQPVGSSTDGCRYNIPLINALVLFVGQAAIQAITPKHISMSSIAHSSHMDIFQNLAVDLDTEGRYLFLNAIANQLRYPNSHTHYFSCTLLYIFAESNTEAIQEQITRVLLERLIVNRPHPWGLLITFIELIKNQSFKFWNHEFVRCAPEIEKLFESVGRSCMQQQQQQQKNQSNANSVQGENLIRSQSS